MKREYRTILIFALIIMAQVLVMIYWAHVKTNYNIDELYSMGFARGYVSQIYTPEYITVGREFHFNEWMSNETLKGYLVMKDEAKVINAPFSVTMKEFILGRNYFGFLNFAESFSNNKDLSPIPGITLNIVFFIIAQIMLVRLMINLRMDDICTFLAVCMFGFSGYMISSVEFIRFYMMIIMLSLIIVNLLFLSWREKSQGRLVLIDTTIMVIAYFVYKNSEFFIPFFGSLVTCYIIASIIKKKWKESLPLLIMLIVGLLFVASRIGLFRTGSWMLLPLKTRRTIAGVLTPSINGMGRYIVWLIGLFKTHYFGSGFLMALFFGVIIICIVLLHNERKTRRSSIARNGITLETQFVFIIICATIVFTVFITLCQYDVWRYCCFCFVFATFGLWYLFDRLIRSINSKFKGGIRITLTVLVIVSSLLPFITRPIEYMYEDEKGFLERLEDVSDLDVVMLLPANEVTILSEELTYLSRHAIYDCVCLMPEKTRIFVADSNDYNYSTIPFPTEFVLWTKKNQEDMDLSMVFDDLKMNGYFISELGSDHDSLVYIAKYSN